MHLSTEQRVLLHIQRYAGKKSEWEAPYELSQAGISGALHLPQSTISRTLKALKNRGLVEDRLMYIRGERRKKNGYFLTPQGIEEARKIEKELLSEPVKIKVRDSVRAVSIAEALEIIRAEKGASLHPAEIYRNFVEKGIVDTAEIYSDKKRIMFHVPEERGDFVGRAKEMSLIEKKMEESPFILVKGMAGMGKSSMLSKLAHKFSSEYHIFWYSIRKAKGILDLIKELNEFLRLVGAKTVERKRGVGAFFEELQNIKAMLIFDDLQYANKEMLEFIRELAERTFSEPCRFLMMFSSREELKFRKEEFAKGRVFEIELGPLEKDELEPLFPDREKLDKAYSLTGGIPLFIELYRNTGFRPSDAKRIMEEEVFSALSAHEMEAMKMLSVHRIPVYPEALSDINPETIENLRKKLLIAETEEWKLDAHELLKEIIYRSMPIKEREKYHEKAAEYYLSQWCDDEDRFEAVYHLQMAGKWEKSAEIALKIASEFPLSGNLDDIMSNFHRNMEKVPESLRGELLVLIGDILAYENRWEDSVEYYSEAERYAGKTEELEERIARAKSETENWEESIRIEKGLLKKAEEEGNPRKVAKHHIALGNTYLRSGNPTEALKHYLNAEKILLKLKNRDGLAVVYNNIGNSYINIEDFDKAERYLKKSLRYSKGKGNVGAQSVSNLGYIYERKGNLGAAEKAYRDALKYSKNPVFILRILRRLNSILLESGNWDGALSILKRSLNDIPDGEKWIILDLMADAYRKGRKYEDAIATRKKALSLNRNTRLRLSLIEDLIEAGRLLEAMKVLEEEEKIISPWDYEMRSGILLLKGKIFSLKGENNRALDAYGELVRMAEEAGDMEKAEIARKLLKEME